MYRILSIDGGGVRGLVPALLLAELERRAERPVAELFDLVAGTSTGAIIALGLTCPGDGDGPRWRAADLDDFYDTGSPRIFGRTLWRTVRTADGFLAPKYDAGPLEDLLRSTLGETMLREALCDVLITTYDTRARRPHFFKSAQVRAGNADDTPMWMVARASASPPTYFAPMRVGGRWLVDGGVYANSPAMCAYAEARRARPDADVAVVSVGTGELSTDFATARVRRGGALVWARPLLDIVLDGQENVTDYQLRQVLPADRYHRFQATLDARSARIDDGRPRTLGALRECATRLIGEMSGELDTAVALLTGARPEPSR